MKQTPLTNMENRWVHSTKEAFDALVVMGYKARDKYIKLGEILVVLSDNYIYQTLVGGDFTKQAYYNNGHFYDEPYEEFTITEEKVPFPEFEGIESVNVKVPKFIANALDGVLLQSTHSFKFKMYNKYEKAQYDKYKELHENSKDFKVTWSLKDKVSYEECVHTVDNATGKCTLCGYSYDEGNRILKKEIITEEKVPFPELDDIEWVMVEAKEWYGKGRIEGFEQSFKYQLAEFQYTFFKKYYENSKDFKVT